jgi:hypothetical protein
MQPDVVPAPEPFIASAIRRPLAIIWRRGEDLEPAEFPVEVSLEPHVKKTRRRFASDEEFDRYQAALGALTAKYQKIVNVVHPVPRHAWRGGDLYVILGHIENLLPLPSETVALQCGYARNHSLANVWISAQEGNEHRPDKTVVSLVNGSGFMARATVPGRIPSRALVALAQSPCTEMRVEMTFISPQTFHWDREDAMPEVRARGEEYAARKKAKADTTKAR